MNISRNNCYMNSAYSGYYDSCEEEKKSFTTEDSNEDDDRQESLHHSDDNETFVDEFYEDDRSNIVQHAVSSSALQLLGNRHYIVAGNPTTVQAARRNIDQTPITSTPKKSAITAPRPIAIRRRLDMQQQQQLPYWSPSVHRLNSSMHVRRQANTNIRRCKSVVNIPRGRGTIQEDDAKRQQYDSLSIANASFTASGCYTNYALPVNQQQRDFARNRSFRTEPIPSTAQTNISRKPSDATSVCSSRPLLATSSMDSKKRTTAIISPIYNVNRRYNASQNSTPATPRTAYSAFQVATYNNCSSSSRNNTTTISSSTSSKIGITWLNSSSPSSVCTLRVCALILLLTGAFNCFLCVRITLERGKSYELAFAFAASFAALTLGFPCFGFQRWQWLPNRNYVSGYIILCLFSSLQTGNLWLLRTYSSSIPAPVADIAKGAMCGISALTLLIAILGLISSYCCKYPPPDNRVSHAVESFRI